MKPAVSPILLTVLFAVVPAGARGEDFDAEPIRYRAAAPSNPVSRLEERIREGGAPLEYEDQFGYLRSVLKGLKVPESSQTLVFSKTSLQRNRISPATPRALYFNDDVYLGYCDRGDVLEISVADEKLGTVFYTLDQRRVDRPQFVRQDDNCLLCHGSSSTHGVPGHVLRSVYTDEGGFPILSAGTYRTDHTSPIEKRRGGWYVTGQQGTQTHLGNVCYEENSREPKPDADGRNRVRLPEQVQASRYLTPHSDVVALMVLEHQAQAHNLITKASFETRLALHTEAQLNRELNEPADKRWGSTTSRIRSAGEALVKYLLFKGEAPLEGPVSGTSDFAREFAARGPQDPRGRSLRDFDLTTRMFKYPCSYLIYSPSFDALPEAMRAYVYDRLHAVLTGRDTSPDFAHLTAEDRRAILEILTATKNNLPAAWTSPAPR